MPATKTTRVCAGREGAGAGEEPVGAQQGGGMTTHSQLTHHVPTRSPTPRSPILRA